MHVTFKRTGERRYAVIVELTGKPSQSMEPAPGYDDDIPHDLVHYVVEAELELRAGVYGRAARGGGTFIVRDTSASTARELSRQRRKQLKREAGMGARDDASGLDMRTSERLAGVCDLAWRRAHGQKPDPALWKPPEPLSREDDARVRRVVARLEQLAPLWRALPVDGALRFEWPSAEPVFPP